MILMNQYIWKHIIIRYYKYKYDFRSIYYFLIQKDYFIFDDYEDDDNFVCNVSYTSNEKLSLCRYISKLNNIEMFIYIDKNLNIISNYYDFNNFIKNDISYYRYYIYSIAKNHYTIGIVLFDLIFIELKQKYMRFDIMNLLCKTYFKYKHLICYNINYHLKYENNTITIYDWSDNIRFQIFKQNNNEIFINLYLLFHKYNMI